MKRFLSILIVLSVVAAVIFAIGMKQFNKQTPDAGSQKADFEFSALEFAELIQEQDDNDIMQTFGGKIIRISGEVEVVIPNKESYDILIATNDPMVGINVNLTPEMSDKAKLLSEGDNIVVQGFFSGKLIDIELNRGVIVE
jgi:cytochrome c-type biogenesis protein CcmE